MCFTADEDAGGSGGQVSKFAADRSSVGAVVDDEAHGGA